MDTCTLFQLGRIIVLSGRVDVLIEIISVLWVVVRCSDVHEFACNEL